MKELITEGYEIIAKNTRKEREKLIDKIIKSSEEGYGKKRLGNKRKKYMNKEGNIPRMKGLPRTHKEEIGLRPIVNGKGTVLEELEAEMALVLRVVENRQAKIMLKNSEELVEEWKDVCLEEDETMFSLDVEKMFTSPKRNEVKKEVERLIEEEEIIRGWKKEEIVKHLEYVWENQYYIIEGGILKIKEGLGIGSKMSPVLAEILMKKWEKEKK